MERPGSTHVDSFDAHAEERRAATAAPPDASTRPDAGVLARLRDGALRLLLRALTVAERHEPAPGFVRLALAGDSLRGARVTPGDKLQLHVARGAMRTYTPFAHDRERGRLEILAYLHGDEPGSRWARTAQVGSTIFALGPRRSIELSGDLSSELGARPPIVLFGDETSFAVARALGERTTLDAFLEVGERGPAEAALRDLGIAGATPFPRAPADAHLVDVAEAIAARAAPEARLVLTGRAQSIQRVRALLRERRRFAVQKVKAYWSTGKRGLD